VQAAPQAIPQTVAALNALDYLIVAAYFAVTLLVGLRLRRRTRTSEEYFQAGRSLPALVTGIAFVAANSGALEIMGVISTSAKYGARAAHFYWIGAIPAMLFLALFMMPIYYRSGVRSVPEFLKVRFGERTRLFNALSFAVLTVLVSGISMYAIALVLHAFLGWAFGTSVLVSAVVVLAYVASGGLAATIYNEVLQFVLIVVGLTPLVYFVLREFGGLGGLTARLPAELRHTWAGMPLLDPGATTMDVFGTVFGLGFVLSFGYWCTDFLLVQRALAAKDLRAAVNTPLVAAVPKLFFPALVVLPGLAAVALFPRSLVERYDLALPALLTHYYGHGLLGLGVTAMLASFMSGMAGNVTAFNTVWTYDLYQAYLAPGRPDAHYLRVGRLATVAATLLSVGTAYLVLHFNSLMDYVQLLFSFFNAPLFATFLFGMFTRWATPAGGFWGLASGTAAAVAHYALQAAGVIHYPSAMTANFYGAIVAFVVCAAVTAGVSAAGGARARGVLPAPVARLGEVMRTPRAWASAGVIAAVAVALSVAFY
jgi:SSS family solute:Na+ symporter